MLFFVLVLVVVLVLDSTAARLPRQREAASEPHSWAFRGQHMKSGGIATPRQVDFLFEGRSEDEDDDEDEDD